MKTTTSGFILSCLLLMCVFVCGTFYEQKIASDQKLAQARAELMFAKKAEDRAKQALLDEHISRFLECTGAGCANRWPDAAQAVAEAKKKK